MCESSTGLSEVTQRALVMLVNENAELRCEVERLREQLDVERWDSFNAVLSCGVDERDVDRTFEGLSEHGARQPRISAEPAEEETKAEAVTAERLAELIADAPAANYEENDYNAGYVAALIGLRDELAEVARPTTEVSTPVTFDEIAQSLKSFGDAESSFEFKLRYWGKIAERLIAKYPHVLSSSNVATHNETEWPSLNGVREPRVIQFGERIPADVLIVRPADATDFDRFAVRNPVGGWNYAESLDEAGEISVALTAIGFLEFDKWEYPLTEVLPETATTAKAS